MVLKGKLSRVLISVMVSGAMILGLFAASPAVFVDNEDSTAYAASGTVKYIAVLGADRWVNADGTPHLSGSDLQVVARIDTGKGTVNLLTVPRDTRYDKVTKFNKDAKILKSNYAFQYGFYKVMKMDEKTGQWTNYSEKTYAKAIASGAKAACTMIKDITGITVSDYAVVDLNTYQEIVTKLEGVTVNLPLPIKDYRLYSDGSIWTLNKGKTGTATLNGWDAMIASRARTPYGTTHILTGKKLHKYTKKSDYKGDYPQLLIKKTKSGKSYYYFDQDSVRQYLNRRTITSLMLKGMAFGSGTASFVWDQLVSQNLMWTSLTQKEVKTLADGLVKAKNSNKLVINCASCLDATNYTAKTLNGVYQGLIQPDSKQIKATVKQFKAGAPMTSGFGAETTYGIAKGATKKSGGITYKATSNTGVAVYKSANKKSVSIPATVKLNGKTYKVTSTSAKAFTGSKIRTVTFGSNISKLSANTFANSKVTKLVLQTTKLTKSKVKNSLKGSKVSKIQVSVDSSVKKATTAKYKTYFANANSGKTKAITWS